MKKRSHVDIFTNVKDVEKYTREFRGLPNLKNIETAQATIKKLDRLYTKYKKAKDKNGMLHCKLIAEIAENQTMRKGKIAQQGLYADWLKKIRR
ncbi:hypothetical protein ACFLZB_02550 [Nanoarchaeota archaeon]